VRVLLTVLGCSGSIPGPNRPASGYLLEADGFRLVLDLGNGTLAELQSLLDPFALDALLLSHLHPDHCADFSALTVLRRYHPNPPYDPRTRRLPVYAPTDAPARLVSAYAPCEEERAGEDLSDVHEFHGVDGAELQIGPFRVTAFPLAHPCSAYGFRIFHDGATLAYTGDTGVCPGLCRLAAGATVLLSEASWTDAADRPENVHLSGLQAGQVAARAGGGELLLTHVPPWTDAEQVLAEATSAAGEKARMVEQGARYTIAR
jgi:ribonuclease BN (tRNA processing enzyme)